RDWSSDVCSSDLYSGHHDHTWIPVGMLRRGPCRRCGCHGDLRRSASTAPTCRSLPQAAALDPGLTQQLAMLLLGHALAALLDHRAHTEQPFRPRLARGRPARSAFRVTVRWPALEARSGGLAERLPQVLVNRPLRDPK